MFALHRRAGRAAALAAVAALALTGCGSSAEPASSASQNAAGSTASANASETGWPRTVKHAKGETEVKEAPQRIVSTSITLTGSLLAIDAPVAASAATDVSAITDKNGFFSQWSEVASERGVEVLYPNLEFDEEAVIAADPDLIVVSTSGADSTVDQYEKLSKIAPTIVLDYGKQSWQDLAQELGAATGHEAGAQQAMDTFETRVDEVKAKVETPAKDANVVVWNGTSKDTAFAKPGSPHADLIDSLGFTTVGADDSMDLSEKVRSDFAFVSLENAVTSMSGSTVFVASGNEDTVKDLKATSVLKNAPAVKADRVVALGDDSFRIDYFSALNIVQKVEDALS
jgi:iron complex transport system substrate-binding protein